MTQLRVSIVGTKELQRRLHKLNPAINRRIMVKSLSEAAVDILADVQKVQIVGGRGKALPLADRLTNRSGGRGLVGSMGIDRRPLPKAIEIGTHLTYGAVHEEGRGRYPRRAFLAPALEKIGGRIPGIIIKNWKREGGI
jgi:hypothetical protein